jgi:hypothetical protein
MWKVEALKIAKEYILAIWESIKATFKKRHFK